MKRFAQEPLIEVQGPGWVATEALRGDATLAELASRHLDRRQRQPGEATAFIESCQNYLGHI